MRVFTGDGSRVVSDELISLSEFIENNKDKLGERRVSGNGIRITRCESHINFHVQSLQSLFSNQVNSMNRKGIVLRECGLEILENQLCEMYVEKITLI